MITKYDYGNKLRSTVTFTDIDGDPIDPSAVMLKYKDGDGTITTLTYGVSGITKLSTGVYYADISLVVAGRWKRRWYSTGTGQASTPEDEFIVSTVETP